MADDIVTRLRDHLVRHDTTSRTHWDGCVDSHPICALAWALDEIERLRAVILEWDASTDCFWDDVDSHDAAVQRYRAARAAAVKEARRG